MLPRLVSRFPATEGGCMTPRNLMLSIFGMDNLLGSIEVGKMANLIVTDGDPLEFKTNVKHMFINGKPVDLSSRHTRLYDKFKDGP
jgi:adenine deaminase